MPRFFLDISMSLDGFVAGPNATLEEPLGVGGERLHDWVLRLASWRSMHGLEGGETVLYPSGIGCVISLPSRGRMPQRPPILRPRR